jgi:radical SAM superfamily enzyme YgiQ (UPF0313 family)
MQVLFVHTALPGVRFNSSIAALSAWLRQLGHLCSVLIVPEGAQDDEVSALFRESSAEVVAFSFMTCCASRVQHLAPLARKALPQARLIAGGAHPTTYPQATLATFDLDAIGVGEGEEPLRQWIEDPHHAHPGILRKGQDDPLVRWWVPEVDALPDWHRTPFGAVPNEGNRYEVAAPVPLGRGFCPFTCSFCGVDAYRRANQQPTSGAMRLRSPERVIAEMEAVKSAMTLPHGFAVWDEVLPPPTWLRRFMALHREKLGLPLAAQARVEQINAGTVGALVEGGCDYLVLGIETGDEDYRAKFLNKPFTNDQVRGAARLLHEAGVTVFASFMVGLPFETPQMLAKTVRLAQEMLPAELSWKYYTPERGTRLFELVESRNLLIEAYIDHPFGAHEAMIKLTGCTQADIDKAQRALSLLRGSTAPGTYERAPEAKDTLRLVRG